MKLQLMLFWLLVLSTTITGHKGTRIIGGSNAGAGQFPFLAAIFVQTIDSKFFCTGAFMNFRWVLTSGNCVNNGVLFTVRLASIYLDDPDALVVATPDYLLHPDFNASTITADIGLIKFRMFIWERDDIRPSFLYGLDISKEFSLYSIGWGSTSDAHSEVSNVLRYANVTTLTNENCKVYYGSQVTENMTCVEGSYNEGTCIGDNGGPLFFVQNTQFNIVGVASFISANGCESVEPSGYTVTLPYYMWVINNVYGSH